MAFNLRNRNFLKELDFTPEELKFLLKLSADLKAAKYGGYEQPRLTGKNIALIFEKTSTRTRCAFEVAAYDQGAHVTYLGPEGSQIGHKESMKDTARVLGPHVRRHRVPRLCAGDRRDPGPVRRRAGVERADERVSSDADAVRYPDDDRAQRQAAGQDRLLLPGRCAQQHGQLADGDGLQDGHGRAAVRAQGAVARATSLVDTCRQVAAETGARLTLDGERRRGREGRGLSLHRRVGLDGRAEGSVGRAHRAAQAVPGQRGRRSAGPATRR